MANIEPVVTNNDDLIQNLTKQIQLARLKGDTAAVSKLTAQLEQVSADSGTDVPDSSGNLESSFKEFATKYPETAAVNPPPGVDVAAADSNPTSLAPQPTTALTPTDTGVAEAQPTVIPAAAAPTFKNPNTPVDRSGIESLADILSKDKGARDELQTKLDKAETDDDESYKSGAESRKKTYDEGKNKNEWLGVAERVAQAVAQYGAARQGLRDNVDLSGLKFDKHDYGADTDRLMKERRLEDSEASQNRSVAERRRDKSGARGADTQNRSLSALLRDRDEQMKDRELAAKNTSDSIENENKFKLSKFATESGERGRVDAARERAAGRADARQAGADHYADAKAERIAKEQRDRAAALDKSNEKIEEKVNKLGGDAAGAVALIGDRKTKTKGLSQLKDSLGELGATPEELSAVDKTVGGRGIFGDSQDEVDAKLMGQIKTIRERAAQRTSRAPTANGPATTSAPGTSQPPAPPGKIRVKLKSNGQTGTVDPGKFDPNTMDKI